ncbi:MAG: sensor histidine kinase [Bacteriovoracaceae bacterium]
MQNETSERLTKNIDNIMKLWETRVYKEVDAAHHQEKLALRNSLPEYLSQLASALSTTIDRNSARKASDKADSRRIGQKHGKERASSRDYTIDQLIFEYHILRQVICDVMETEAILTPNEREVIICSIEQAVNDAATEFSDTLKDIQEQMSHTLAHDMRTPLSVAKASAQLILRRPFDSDNCISKATNVCKSLDRMDYMIRDLLDASRLRAGKELALEFQTCDLDWIGRDIVEEGNFVHEGRLKLISPGECLGCWNEDGLRRLLENLSNNAIKYGEPNTPVTITITQDSETATLSVHNEGKPILHEEKAILFQQYRRTRTTEDTVGWGLGLTVVKGMIEAHKGTIDIVSEKGKGTTFIVKLPKDPRKNSTSP